MYRGRYVDDIFYLLRKTKELDKFFKWINSPNPNIQFTSEVECNNNLHLLDINISKLNERKFLFQSLQKTYNYTLKIPDFHSLMYRMLPWLLELLMNY